MSFRVRGAFRGGLAACFFAVFWPLSGHADELHKASEAVHGTGSSGPGHSERSSTGASSSAASGDDSASCSEGSGDSDGSPLGTLAAYAFISPFWIPHQLTEQHQNAGGGWSVLSRPYADGAAGYLLPIPGPSYDGGDSADPGEAEPARPPVTRRPVGVQLAAEGSPPVSGVGRVQARARLITSERIELDAAYGLYLEGPTGSASSAWLGQSHVSFRFAQSPRVQFRAGLGARHWIDHQGSTLGLDGLYAVDVFWGKPMTSTLELSGGSLGSGWAFETRATLGAAFGMGEVYAGYDAIWIGPGSVDGAVAYLGGPLVGLRAYF
jgi:hypothetical protein